MARRVRHTQFDGAVEHDEAGLVHHAHRRRRGEKVILFALGLAVAPRDELAGLHSGVLLLAVSEDERHNAANNVPHARRDLFEKMRRRTALIF